MLLRLRSLVLSLFFLGPLTLHAGIHPDPGSLGVGGEYLYFQPLYDSSYFAQRFTALGNVGGDRLDNPFNYKSAYRVSAIYAFCNCVNDISVRWTQLQNSANRIATGALSTIPISGLEIYNQATSDLALNYEAADALVGQVFYNTERFNLRVQGGAHYAQLKFDQSAEYRALILTRNFEQTNHYWGVGPEIAMDMRYTLPSCLIGLPISINGAANFSLLIGQSEAEFASKVSTSPTFIDARNEEQWRVVPTYDLRFSLSWDPCFCKWRGSIEVGYEVLCYRRVIDSIKLPSSTSALQFDTYDDIDFQGPFAAIGVSF